MKPKGCIVDINVIVSGLTAAATKFDDNGVETAADAVKPRQPLIVPPAT